jgi:hypothetical protein
MADGSIYLGSGGGWKISSDGTWDVCGDCCDTDVRTLVTCEGVATTYHVLPTDANDGDGILYAGVCHTVGGVGVMPGGGTLLDPADFTIDADCCLCSDCGNDLTPDTIELTFSGVTNCCVGITGWMIADNVNGTYCLTRIAACSWQTTTQVTLRSYTPGGSCTGGFTESQLTLTIGVVGLSNGSLLVTVSGNPGGGVIRWFQETHIGPSCDDFVASNERTSCSNSLGTGGTVSAVMNGC